MKSKVKGALNQIKNLVQRHFRAVWQSGSYDDAFVLCNKIRKAIGCPAYSAETFDEGWQYRIILHKDYGTAKEEFVNLVFGWW